MEAATISERSLDRHSRLTLAAFIAAAQHEALAWSSSRNASMKAVAHALRLPVRLETGCSRSGSERRYRYLSSVEAVHGVVVARCFRKPIWYGLGPPPQ